MRLNLALASLLVVSLAACDQPTAPSSEAAAEAAIKDPSTLVLVAGSEVKDMAPLMAQMKAETGVTLTFKYVGTLDGIEGIASGQQYDGAWFSHAKYLMLMPDAAKKVKASEKIMLSPVVIGVKESKVKAFGWNSTTSWAEMARQADKGAFHFAMTNPTSSNSGFSALVGVAASFAGKSDALEESDIDKAGMASLFKGVTLTSGSSGWLADRYVEEQASLDGIVNYESVLLSMNRAGTLKEKLHLIYPQDGVLTADYPLILLNEAKRAAYDKAVAWLKGEKAQTWLMRNTMRRPINPAVPLDKSLFGDTLLVDMAFPGKLSVVNALLLSYLGEQRLPSSTYFVLDVSGSMQGERIEGLRGALKSLASREGNSLTSMFASFQPRERITLIPFSDQVRTADILQLEVDKASPAASLGQVFSYAGALQAEGGTAMYDGLMEAYRRVAEDMARDPNRYYTVVVMTDGETRDGAIFADFKQWFNAQPPAIRKIKTFPVLFGEGSESELKDVATMTGGKYFDSRTTSLSLMFKDIRGYQ